MIAYLFIAYKIINQISHKLMFQADSGIQRFWRRHKIILNQDVGLHQILIMVYSAGQKVGNITIFNVCFF